MLPNFLIIGVQKAGTTSLLNYLSIHPDIFVPANKEISYFHDVNYYTKGINYYEKNFKKWKGEKSVGHAPVNAIFYAKEASKRIYHYNKDIKLIVLLRDPVDRAYSHFWYCKRNCLEGSNTFEEAIDRELQNFEEKELKNTQCFYYIKHGFYFDQLMEYLKYFKKEQILILMYDDFKKNTAGVVNLVLDFLSLDKISDEGVFKKKHNVSSMPKYRFLQKLIFDDSKVKEIYQRVVPESVRESIKWKITNNVLRKNLTPFKYPPINEETRQFLRDIFRPQNKLLSELIEVDLSGWA